MDPAGHFLHVSYLANPFWHIQAFPSHYWLLGHEEVQTPFGERVYPLLQSQLPVLTLKTYWFLQSRTHDPSLANLKPTSHTQFILPPFFAHYPGAHLGLHIPSAAFMNYFLHTHFLEEESIYSLALHFVSATHWPLFSVYPSLQMHLFLFRI